MFLLYYSFPIYLKNWLYYSYAVYFFHTLKYSQIKGKWWGKKMCPWNVRWQVQVRCWNGNRNGMLKEWTVRKENQLTDHLWHVNQLLVCFLSNSASSDYPLLTPHLNSLRFIKFSKATCILKMYSLIYLFVLILHFVKKWFETALESYI